MYFDILSFKNSSDQGKPLTDCFRGNQLIDLQIKMHVPLIYAQSVKNNFERVHFSVKVLSRGWWW